MRCVIVCDLWLACGKCACACLWMDSRGNMIVLKEVSNLCRDRRTCFAGVHVHSQTWLVLTKGRVD